MTWRVANSLLKLRDQINGAYPKRSKISDGFIGDPNHQAEGTGSDHNPNKDGVVCAFDITHDPENGLYIDELSQRIADSRDPRIKYLIQNAQIMVPADYGWKWVTYTGSNTHTSHLHISVYGDYDNTNEWNIGGKKMIQGEDGKQIYRYVYHREPENDWVWKQWDGMTFAEALADAANKPEWYEQHGHIKDYQRLAKENAKLTADVKKIITPAAVEPTELKPGIYKVK